MRDDVVAAGITINGLPIMLKRPNSFSMDIQNLDIYYEDCVIGGPGAFVIPIRERDQFKEAIRTKLVLEIAGRTPERRVRPAGAPAAHLLHHRRADVAGTLGKLIQAATSSSCCDSPTQARACAPRVQALEGEGSPVCQRVAFTAGALPTRPFRKLRGARQIAGGQPAFVWAASAKVFMMKTGAFMYRYIDTIVFM